jgi:adenosine deaminase CECR1
MIGSDSVTLYSWKRLAELSLEHSCMDSKKLKEVKAEWARKWNEFCQWIIDQYGPKVQEWEHKGLIKP